MHFAIFGSGAVGGYYGATLARAGHQVTFIARGAHLRAIRDRGLFVWSPLGDFVVHADATDDPSSVDLVDVVIFAVKTYDNNAAIPTLRSLVAPSTMVLTLQNGVDSVDELAAVVGERAVLGGATYIAAALTAPGLIEQTGTHRRIVFGEVFGECARVSDRVRQLADAMSAADIQTEAVPDARVPLWEKFIYLAAFAALTGAARVPAGPVWQDPDLRARFLDATAEIERVARAEGIAVAPDVQQRIVTYMDALPSSTRSSLLIDLSLGKRIEVEALQGSVVRRGRARGVATPVLATLYAVLKAYAGGTQA